MAKKPARCRGQRWQVVENRNDRTILACIACGARIARTNQKGATTDGNGLYILRQPPSHEEGAVDENKVWE